ncbi:tripartite tricarboxylate transporter TctB family protein [Saccharomonospora halophila]|uniref:tripartite tricarboxylate transporter TctB family protein n=1 Tax=Saccharomonospora halophila TaxID=129922 RepID=UPI0003733422|nr:tripartite tricarboxylate transporter TctB family protein [Saccharomonospora halophila]
MNDFFTLDVEFSDYHLVFPVAIGTILGALLVIMGAKSLIKRFRSAPRPARPRWRFFDRGFDWKKLFGALACMFAYVLLLKPLGFLPASILFVVAISLVFHPTKNTRVLLGMATTAICTPLAIWLVFGQLFYITLP